MGIQPRYLAIAVPTFCSFFCHFHFLLLLTLFSCLPMCISFYQVVQLLEEPIRCELGPGQVLINHPNVCVIQMVHGHVCNKSDSGLGQVSRMSRQPSRHQCCARHIPTQVQICINKLSTIIRMQKMGKLENHPIYAARIISLKATSSCDCGWWRSGRDCSHRCQFGVILYFFRFDTFIAKLSLQLPLAE